MKEMNVMKPTKLKILKVWLEHKHDEDPDTSYLGKYSSNWEKGAIVRIGEHAGKFYEELPEDYRLSNDRREHTFFIPAMTGAETGNPDSPKQDYERMEALNRGDWGYIGIIAKAQVWNPQTQVTQVVRSGGLWGIESDSGKEYLASVELEELAGLKDELIALGIGERAITHAFGNVERK